MFILTGLRMEDLVKSLCSGLRENTTESAFEYVLNTSLILFFQEIGHECSD